ncbi:hypothetical protein ES703_93660 [subsurface metagenome]
MLGLGNRSAGNQELDLLVGEKLALEIIFLPMYPGLSYEQQKEVVDTIKEFVKIGI